MTGQWGPDCIGVNRSQANAPRGAVVEFGEVFLEEKGVDKAGVLGLKGQLVVLAEFFDHETKKGLLCEGFVGEQLGILGNLLVGLFLEVGEGGEELAFLVGGVFFLEEAFVQAGVFGVLLVFGADELVLAFDLEGAFVDGVEGGDVGSHLLGGDFGEILFLEEALQFLIERDELGVAGIEVATEGFASATEFAFEFVGEEEFFFGNFGRRAG